LEPAGVDAFPLSEALAAGNNICHSWSSFPQDMQIVILKWVLGFRFVPFYPI
jgi:hypothetical protein